MTQTRSETAGQVAQAATYLVLTKVNPSCGAWVSGVDLSRPLPYEAIVAVARALHEHGVLSFRDQRLTSQQHVALGAHFGSPHMAAFDTACSGAPGSLVRRQVGMRVAMAGGVDRFSGEGVSRDQH